MNFVTLVIFVVLWTYDDISLKLTGAETIVGSQPRSGGGRWRRHTRLLGAVDSGKTPAKSPCYPNYCRNGGACKLDERQHSGFRCVCKQQFSGVRCDNGTTDQQWWKNCTERPCREELPFLPFPPHLFPSLPYPFSAFLGRFPFYTLPCLSFRFPLPCHFPSLPKSS